METTIGRGRPPGLALVEGRETTVHPLDVGKNAAVQLPGTPLSATVCSPAAIPVAVTLSLIPMALAGPPTKLVV